MTTPIRMLAIDLAKGSFQVCAIGQDGSVPYNRMLSRSRLATLLAGQQSCIVVMEACATSHYWGRAPERCDWNRCSLCVKGRGQGPRRFSDAAPDGERAPGCPPGDLRHRR